MSPGKSPGVVKLCTWLVEPLGLLLKWAFRALLKSCGVVKDLCIIQLPATKVILQNSDCSSATGFCRAGDVEGTKPQAVRRHNRPEAEMEGTPLSQGGSYLSHRSGHT